jgi:hypothetical protein
VRTASIAINSIAVSLAVILSLYLWRLTYPTTDFAVAFLFPLAALIALGTFWYSAAVYRATMSAAVREDSSISWILTGKIRASLRAILLVSVAIPVLAWHALSATIVEFAMLALLCVLTSSSFVIIERMTRKHLKPPFAHKSALLAATFSISLVFIPLLAWANWEFTDHPLALRYSSLGEAVQLGFNQHPARRGWVAEIIAPLYAFEYVKLWFVVQADSPRWFSLWYSLDTALISIFAARVSAILMFIAQLARGGLNAPAPDQ